MKKNNNNNTVKSIVMYGILLVIMIAAVYYYGASRYVKHDFTYDEFIEKITDGKVDNISITPKRASGVYEITGSLDEIPWNSRLKLNKILEIVLF